MIKTSTKALETLSSNRALTKVNCKGYLASHSLSPLNERNLTAIVKAHKDFTLHYGFNTMTFSVVSYSVNSDIISLTYKVDFVNYYTNETSTADLTIKASRHHKMTESVKAQLFKYFPCDKACGHIKENESGVLNFYDLGVIL